LAASPLSGDADVEDMDLPPQATSRVIVLAAMVRGMESGT
jgi:hypothetical protein